MAMVKQIDESLGYWAEVAILDFTEELARVMQRKGVSRTKLARRIDSSPAYITKVMSGNANFTIATMTKLARALDAVLHLHLSEEGVIVRWQDKKVGAEEFPLTLPIEQPENIVKMVYTLSSKESKNQQVEYG